MEVALHPSGQVAWSLDHPERSQQVIQRPRRPLTACGAGDGFHLENHQQTHVQCIFNAVGKVVWTMELYNVPRFPGSSRLPDLVQPGLGDSSSWIQKPRSSKGVVELDPRQSQGNFGQSLLSKALKTERVAWAEPHSP